MDGFKIISKLGEGAYSIVHKVRRYEDDNIYALKKVKLLKLSKKEKENALNEVRILASVKSNFVISYKEAFFEEKDSCLGIVMEFADRGDLYQKITEYRRKQIFFNESDIWRIFIQLVKGLKALHELKILHRDLKSANVFLFSDGSAKLGDLNVSKVAKKGLGYTQTGTPYYASPEVWDDRPYNLKSDIWSLGVVLYEMIMLKPPFRAENMEGLYNKVIKGIYPRIHERYSNDLNEILKLLIQVDPSKRPTCEQILNLPIIQKRIEYFKAFSGDDVSEDQALLQTINIPKNLIFLSDKLPLPNYDTGLNKRNYNSFSNQKGIKPNDANEINMNMMNNNNNTTNNILPEIPIKNNNIIINNSNLLSKEDNTKILKINDINEKENNNIKERYSINNNDNSNNENEHRNNINGRYNNIMIKNDSKENIMNKENKSNNDSIILNKLNNHHNNIALDGNINNNQIRNNISDCPLKIDDAQLKLNINNNLKIRKNSKLLPIRNNIESPKRRMMLPEIKRSNELIGINKLMRPKQPQISNSIDCYNVYNNLKNLNNNNICSINNQKLSNLYKIYAPSIKKIPIKYPRYYINKNPLNNGIIGNSSNINNYYLKSLENQAKYYKLYKPLMINNLHKKNNNINPSIPFIKSKNIYN